MSKSARFTQVSLEQSLVSWSVGRYMYEGKGKNVQKVLLICHVMSCHVLVVLRNHYEIMKSAKQGAQTSLPSLLPHRFRQVGDKTSSNLVVTYYSDCKVKIESQKRSFFVFTADAKAGKSKNDDDFTKMENDSWEQEAEKLWAFFLAKSE